MLPTRFRGPYSHIGAPPRNEGYTDPGLEQKRQAALAYLGGNWVLHPEYQPKDRHDTDPNTYVFARMQYLKDIFEAAAIRRAHTR